MVDAVVKSLKHINNISNSNIVQNVDLLSRKEVEVPVDWIGGNKKSVPPQKFKVDYWLFFVLDIHCKLPDEILVFDIKKMKLCDLFILSMVSKKIYHI